MNPIDRIAGDPYQQYKVLRQISCPAVFCRKTVYARPVILSGCWIVLFVGMIKPYNHQIEENRMNFRNRFMHLACLVGVTTSSVTALTFSIDTVNAFNGKFWNGNGGDDSTMVINSSAQAVIIDSVLVEFDTTGYEEFSISWMMEDSTPNAAQWGKRVGFYTVTDSAAAGELSDRGDFALSAYNQGELPKIVIPAHGSLKMFSPYFSNRYSAAGTFVECSGGMCIPPGSKTYSVFFPGRIIFVAQGERDTLHLNGERFWWDPPIGAFGKPTVQQRLQRPAGIHRAVMVDLQGKLIDDRISRRAKALSVTSGRVIYNLGDVRCGR
jgi:hypothetical protein